MDDLERRRLHDAVRAELRSPVAETDAPPGRFYRALSAVAAVAVIAVAGFWASGSLFGSGSDDAESGGADSSAGMAVPEDATSDAAASTPLYLGLDAAPMEADGDEATTATRLEEPVTERSLVRFVRTDERFAAFAASYLPPFDEALQVSVLESLAGQAPDPDVAAQIADCGRPLTNVTTLTALAVTATYDGKPALILGTVSAPSKAGPLEVFSFVVLPRGDCAPEIDSFGGAL